MECSAPTKCTFSCTGGNCATVVCKADTCEQSCTGGGCGLECHGSSCEQSCTSGSCQLQCPREGDKCDQWCLINKDQCTIEETAPEECNRGVEDGVCYQSCNQGGCDMECYENSSYYHSCEQSCTGMFKGSKSMLFSLFSIVASILY